MDMPRLLYQTTSSKTPIPTLTHPRIQTQTKAAPDTPRPRSSTARLLQRLKTLQRDKPVEPSDSAPDDLLGQTDITDAGTDSLLRAEPPPARGRSSSELFGLMLSYYTLRHTNAPLRSSEAPSSDAPVLDVPMLRCSTRS
jgi:hypothetical protein